MVETRIGLVEHHEEGIAIERTRQADPLALSRRQGGATLAHLGLIAVRQAEDQLVDTGGLRRRDHLRRVRLRLQPGDVLRDRAGEQLHVLRQVADMLAQRLGRPLVERRPIDPDLAGDGPPDADEGPGQRRLARGAGADDPQPLAGLQGERDITGHQHVQARRCHADHFDRQRRLGLGQLHDVAVVGNPGQQVVEPVPALAGRDEDAPLGDHLLDRRERPGREDGAGDDDAGRRLSLDNEVGADRQHRRLQRHAQRAGEAAHAACDVARPLMGSDVTSSVLRPLPGEAADHAHRMQDLRIAAAGFGEAGAPAGERRDLDRRLADLDLGDEGDDDQDEGSDRRGEADQRMEQVADAQVERHPGQVEQRGRTATGHEIPDLFEVADRLEAVHLGCPERQLDQQVIDSAVQRLGKPAGDPDEDPIAHDVQDGLEAVEAEGQDAERDQGGYAAARQHPVVDLEHEKRAGEIQNVEDGGKQRYPEIGGAA